MTGAATATLLRPQRGTIPEELKARPQWVLWRLEVREGKPTKVPYVTPDRRASSTDAATWLSFDAAWALYERGGFDGVGYVFAADDPCTGIDLDPELPARDRQTILQRCRSYTELSPSGHGQHVIVKAKLPSGGRKKGPIEVYDKARYFTVTGHIIEGASMVIEEQQEAVDWLLATYFNDPEPETRSERVDPPNLSDQALLDKAFAAANGDKLRRLWNGDTTDYPSASEADMALASRLAFWTGPDAMKLEALLRRSGLAREKWDTRHYGDGQTYLEGVVAKTLSGRTEFYAAGNHAADRQEKKGAEGPSGAVVIRLSDVVPESVSWAWRNYIPLGKPAILEGDPGLGKSTLALDFAARVSTGAAMPDGSPTEPGGVVILSLEDGLADTIVPRLKAAGADLTRIVALEGVGREGKVRLPTVEDIDAIKEACEAVEAKLVIIDPLMGYLSSKQNSWRDQDMRSALGPLAKLSEKLGFALVLIRHLNKATGGQAIYRGGGSIGIVGASRIAFLIAKDPQDDNRRVMACVKTNLGPMPPSLSYTIEGVGETSHLVWGGPTGHTANELLLAMPASPEERSAVDDAADFLRSFLEKGPKDVREIQRSARLAGIADATLRRAKSSVGLTSKRDTFGAGGKWLWALDAQESPKVLNQKHEHLRHGLSILDDFEEVLL